MTITPAQRARIQATGREAVISSSQVPTVLAINPYETRGDLYLRLTGQVPWSEPNDAMRRGIEQEPVTLARASERLGVELITDPEALEFVRAPHFVSHPDALVVGRPEIVEAKLTRLADDWGEEETAEVPDHVHAQVQHQMLCAEREVVWVMPALLSYGIEYRLYCVPRDEQAIRQIEEECQAFLENHVWPGHPPEEAPSLETLKRMPRERRLSDHELDFSLLEEWRESTSKKDWCRRLLKEAEDRHKKLSARIVSEMGDADAIRVRGMHGEFNFHARRGRTTYSRNHPDKCEACGVGSKRHPDTHVLRWDERPV